MACLMDGPPVFSTGFYNDRLVHTNAKYTHTKLPGEDEYVAMNPGGNPVNVLQRTHQWGGRAPLPDMCKPCNTRPKTTVFGPYTCPMPFIKSGTYSGVHGLKRPYGAYCSPCPEPGVGACFDCDVAGRDMMSGSKASYTDPGKYPGHLQSRGFGNYIMKRKGTSMYVPEHYPGYAANNRYYRNDV